MTSVDEEHAPGVEQMMAIFREAIPAHRAGSLDQIRAGYEDVLAQLPIAEGTSLEAATYGGVDGYWVRAAGASTGRIGVMLHGGGFVMGSAKGYCAFAADISQATGSSVFVPEYRLAPEHPFPAGRDDAAAVIAAAVSEVGPESCFAIGDSAGGGLMVTSLVALHDSGLPVPQCVVMVSALVDLTVSNASFEELASVDPLCAQPGTRRNVALYLDGAGPDEAPGAFPMTTDLSWFPPSLLMVGGREVLRDDSRNLAEKLEREGVDVTLHEYDGMLHVWPLFSSIVPKGREAVDEIGAFVTSRVTESTPA